MAYVSCKYAPPPPFPNDPQMILCVDENGTEWWVPPDCEVTDWLRYIEAGGTIDPYEPPAEETT